MPSQIKLSHDAKKKIHCLLLFLICIISLYANLIVGNWLVYHFNRDYPQDPLPDVLLDILPSINGYDFKAVYLPFILFSAFLMIWFILDTRRVQILSVLFTVISITFTIRALTVIVTIVPPTKYYERLDVKLKNIWIFNGNVWNIYGDGMFSGLVTASTALYLTYLTFISKKEIIVQTIIISILYAYFCIMALFMRYTYTNGVLVALFISIPMFLWVKKWFKENEDTPINYHPLI